MHVCIFFQLKQWAQSFNERYLLQSATLLVMILAVGCAMLTLLIFEVLLLLLLFIFGEKGNVNRTNIDVNTNMIQVVCPLLAEKQRMHVLWQLQVQIYGHMSATINCKLGLRRFGPCKSNTL